MWVIWLLVFFALAYVVVGAVGLILSSLNDLLIPAAVLTLAIGVAWAALKALEWMTGLVPAKIDEGVFQVAAVAFAIWLIGSWAHGVSKGLWLLAKDANKKHKRA